MTVCQNCLCEAHALPQVRRPSKSFRPLLFVLAVVGLSSAGLISYSWSQRNSDGLTPDASPRVVASRGELDGDEKGTADLFKTVSPSVVHVTNLAMRRDRVTFDVQEVPRGTGTGFIWDDNGFIVTNYHVVDGAGTVRVILADQSSYDSKQIWSFPDKDLAVVRIDAPKSKLRPIVVGTSQDLQVGQKALAIGNPFGLDQSLTTGVISALGREIESTNGRVIRGVIQTSAPINPGNSGGPLLDSAGRLIGVNTAILSPSGAFAGIGFAIPVDEVNRVVPQLIAHGKVVRPRLGIQIAADQQARRLGVTEGALIFQVIPGGPAEKAKLHGIGLDEAGNRVPGDVLVALDGRSIRSGKDLYAALEEYKPGDTVTLTYVRGGQQEKVKATLDVSS
jgi:S1-C subfamily serine protease